MGPVEKELRRGADVCSGNTGLNGAPYESWPGIAAWSLGGYAVAVFSSAADKFGENGVDAWSEAIEAAEALGL